MNNAKMWLVVSPNVGVPLFLGAVAVGSFAVHLAVLSKTHWFEDFASGRALGTTSSAMLTNADMGSANATYVAPGSQEVLITLSDGSTARAVLEAPTPAKVVN
ncbi:MAG: light-harvesting protein [Alphaproteobacteria bacterium]|jgi:light-harvesting protein B-800-850 alpha chain